MLVQNEKCTMGEIETTRRVGKRKPNMQRKFKNGKEYFSAFK
jgi:hypothetical protein